MNGNESRTLWISIGAALLGVFLVYSYTQEKRAELTKEFAAKKQVVVAKQDINEMETIDETMLETIEQPASFIQPKALSAIEMAVGKVALAPIKTGEQILESKILRPGPITGLSLQVSPTKRAITIPIDEIRGVAKLIKPGDRVDIVAALDVGRGRARKKEVKTIMQDVVILATGLRITNELPRLFTEAGKGGYITNLRADVSFSNVTIETNPKQAQNLVYILATSPGSLFMTLRHPADHARVRGLGSTDVYKVLGKVAPSIGSTRRPATRGR